MFEKKDNVKSLQMKAFEKGRQLQYQEDLKTIEKLREKHELSFLKHTDELNAKRKRELDSMEIKLKERYNRYAEKKLSEYKQIVSEKEQLIRTQNKAIKELRSDNKRLISAVKITIRLRNTILKILDKHESYYSVVESALITIKQKLYSMKDELEVKGNFVGKYEDDIYDLISEIENKSDKASLTLVKNDASQNE